MLIYTSQYLLRALVWFWIHVLRMKILTEIVQKKSSELVSSLISNGVHDLSQSSPPASPSWVWLAALSDFTVVKSGSSQVVALIRLVTSGAEFQSKSNHWVWILFFSCLKLRSRTDLGVVCGFPSSLVTVQFSVRFKELMQTEHRRPQGH